MTVDIRTAARREAERLMPLTGGVMDGGRETWHRGFAHGAVWGAARVTPTREQIAEALRRHNFDELLLGSIEWDGYTAVCACGWSSEEYKMPGEAHDAHSEHAASHVLELLHARAYPR